MPTFTPKFIIVSKPNLTQENSSMASHSKPLNPNAHPFHLFPKPILQSLPPNKPPFFFSKPYLPYFWPSFHGYWYHYPQPSPYLSISFTRSICDVQSQLGDGIVKEGHVRKNNEVKDVRRFRSLGRKRRLQFWRSKPAEKSSGSDVVPPVFDVIPSGTTTLMIKNIPNQLKRNDILNILDQHCRKQNRRGQWGSVSSRSEYDFVYLPMDFRRFWYEGKVSNLGYAFVNFTNATAAAKFYEVYHSYEWEVSMNRKICQITCARIQGKLALKEAFKNKIFWCHADHYLPVMLAPASDGWRRYRQITVGKRIATVPPKPIRKGC